jgi:translation initiation factor IF-3
LSGRWRWRISTTSIRVNDRIRSAEIRLIDEEGTQLGIMSPNDAMRIAEQRGLDLVEVAPQAGPPVCRIMDFGKYKYELAQKEKRSRKHQSQIVVKEMKLRPKIEDHDFETKKKHIVRFLDHGDKVKVTIMFRGREMTHTELGLALLKRMAADVEELAIVESPPKLDGRNMIMVLSPVAKKEKKEEKEPRPPLADEQPDAAAQTVEEVPDTPMKAALEKAAKATPEKAAEAEKTEAPEKKPAAAKKAPAAEKETAPEKAAAPEKKAKVAEAQEK